MRVCLFSSYSESIKIDNYVKYYLSELKKYFDTIVFITNQRALDNDALLYLNENLITLKMVQNMGYDFGMYYNVIKDLDTFNVSQLALVNDSCYLFKPLNTFFNWYSLQNVDCAGFTDSVYKGRHIQSYFLLFSKRVIPFVKQYFMKNGIITDVHKLIETYEIGMCQAMISEGYTIDSMFKQSEFNNNSNIMTENAFLLLQKGIPLIKRKLVLNTFREDEISYLEHVKFDFSINYRQVLASFTSPDVLSYILNQHRVKVYQIYYDEDQLKYLSPDTLPYYNTKLSPFFENDVIRHMYNNNMISSDFFGVLSWKFKLKNDFQYMNSYIDNEADIYAFPNSIRNHNVYGDSAACHPLFMDIFSNVLQLLGCSNINPSLGLYMNSIICRSNIFKKYVEEFLIPTMDYLNSLQAGDPIYEKLWSDARYHYDPNLTQRLQQHIGKPHYTYHTFICERLWSVFYEKYKNRYTLKIVSPTQDRIMKITMPKPVTVLPISRNASIVESIEPKEEVQSSKDFAIVISHLSDRHILERINQENKIYDLYLTSFDNLDISKWHHLFKKHEIVSVKAIENKPSALEKSVYQNVYMCSVSNQLWQNEEQIVKQRYKVIVYGNSLTMLSNIIDVYKMKIQNNTLYVKKSPVKYWFAKAEVMKVFSQIFTNVKDYTGSFDDVVTMFAIKRNIKIIEV